MSYIGNDLATDQVFLPDGIGAVSRTIPSKLKDTVSVKDFGAVGDGVADDTAAIQAAINHVGGYNPACLVFPGGAYRVTSLTFDNFYTTYWFDQAQIAPYGTTPVDALIQITNREQTFHGLQVNGDNQTHFTSAIRIHSVSGSGKWPGFVRLLDLNILLCKIGVLYGAFTAPVDAPVSENTIDGYTTRGVERPLYLNQPNGFLNLTNSVLDCADIAGLPGYDATVACCIENKECILKVSNCELLKVTTTAGYGIKNYSHLSISCCDAEIAAPHFFVGNGSQFHINGYHSVFWSNGTDWFFECENNAVAKIFATNLTYVKSGASAGSGNGLIRVRGSAGVVAYFSNCMFTNQNSFGLMSSTMRQFWAFGDIRFKSCYIQDTANSLYLPIDNSSKSIGIYYNTPDLANFNITTTGAATVTLATVSQPSFTKALVLTGSGGATCEASTKAVLPQRIEVEGGICQVEVSMYAEATNPNIFSASFYAIVWDNGGNLLGYQQFGEGDGAIGHINATSGVQDWKTIRRVVVLGPNASYIQLVFSLNTTAVWKIGTIRVY